MCIRDSFNELIDEIGVPQIVDHLMAAIERRLAKTDESVNANESQATERSQATDESKYAEE